MNSLLNNVHIHHKQHKREYALDSEVCKFSRWSLHNMARVGDQSRLQRRKVMQVELTIKHNVT